MITETTITRFEGFDPHGTPEFFRARKALQYSNSIDDYVKMMLDGNNGGYANDWLIGDNKTGEIARFELGLKEHSVERTKDGYFVGSNFPVGKALIAKETTSTAPTRAARPTRATRGGTQLMAQHKGQIDAEIGKRLESDVRPHREEGRPERAIALRHRRDVAARHPGLGLAAVLPRRHRAGEGHDGRDGREDAALGRDGPSVRPDFVASDFLTRIRSSGGRAVCSAT